MPETQRPRQAHQRPYSAGDHSTYTPLLPAPSGEVIFEMENIPKYPESICARAPSQPPPYQEIDTNWLENENVYVSQADISRSVDNERGKKKAKKDEKHYNIRIWFLVAFLLLIIIGASIGGPLGAAMGKANREKNDPVPAETATQTSPTTAATTTATATAPATVTNTVTVTQTAAPDHETTFDDEDEDEDEDENHNEDRDDDGGLTTYHVVQQAQPKPQPKSRGLLTRIWRWFFG